MMTLRELIAFVQQAQQDGASGDEIPKVRIRMGGGIKSVQLGIDVPHVALDANSTDLRAKPVVFSRDDLPSVHREEMAKREGEAPTPALPDDEDKVLMSGRGELTYAEARALAISAGMELGVSSGMVGEPPRRMVYLQAPMLPPEGENLPDWLVR
jgi:hypothetical protein